MYDSDRCSKGIYMVFIISVIYGRRVIWGMPGTLKSLSFTTIKSLLINKIKLTWKIWLRLILYNIFNINTRKRLCQIFSGS